MILWSCPKCGVVQRSDDVKTVEITESGRGQRIEYHGVIRPECLQDGTISFSCLVCGNDWFNSEDPHVQSQKNKKITVLYPITECDNCCTCGCAMRERESC